MSGLKAAPAARRGLRSGRIAAGMAGQRAPLTLMQQRVWFVEASSPGRADFNICTAHRLRGPVNQAALCQAFEQLVARHEALRLRMAVNDAGDVQQWVAQEGPHLAVCAWPGLEDQALLTRLATIRQQAFDLNEGPLCRAVLAHVGEHEAVFMFVGHHLICDGWSTMLISEDMARLYQLACEGQVPAEAPSGPGYLDFACWQAGWLEGPQAQAELDHWARLFTPLPEPLALDPARAGKARPVACGAAEPTPQRIQVPLTPALLAEVRALARSLDVSLFAVMLAAYTLVLSRTSGQDEVVVGMPTKGRHDEEMASVLGFFVNTLPLRLQVRHDECFADLARRCHQAVQASLDHAELPFERLLPRLPLTRLDDTHPVYQALFSYLDLRSRVDHWGALHRQSLPVPTFGGAEDVSLLLVERQGGSVLEWCFRSQAVSPHVADRLTRRFVVLLSAVLQPEGPQQLAGQITLMDEAEQADLQAWSLGQAPLDTALCACPTAWAQVQASARAHAERPALIGMPAQQDMAYSGLMQAVARAARGLRAQGIGPGMRVALWMPQGPVVTQAILALWACRAAYVPLDPAHPPARLAAILADAGCVAVLCHAVQQVPPGEGAALPSLHWDALQAWGAQADEVPPKLPADVAGDDPAADTSQAQDVAYVMYTSGSTGVPKGVVVTQGAVAHLLAALRATLALGPDDRWLAVTTPCFDISVLESFLPLVSGAALLWADADQVRDPAALAWLVQAHQVSALQATPAGWRLLLASGWGGSAHGRFLALIGGEALPADLAHQMLARGLDVWNMYGPTETTVWSTCARITPSALQQGVAIGRPIGRTQVVLRDAAGQPCLPGVLGEVHLAGPGVAWGYWQRDALNARHFLTLPDLAGVPQRGFATGDLAYWDADGQLHCLGRTDRQIKWRGFRIEAEEVEAALMAWGLFGAVVVKLLPLLGEPTLVAFAEGPQGPPPDWRQRLAQALPPYMLPQHLLHLAGGIPRLPNGKVDHQALGPGLLPQAADTLVPGSLTAAAGQQPMVLSPVGQAWHAIWCSLLQVPQVGPQDNFFDLGGHSLLALKACNLLAQRHGLSLRPQRLVFDSFFQLVTALDHLQDLQAAQASLPAPPTASTPGGRAQQAEPWHRRLWRALGPKWP